MKKVLSYAWLLIALPFAITSCSNDNDLPQVDFQVSFSGATIDADNGMIYVVTGDTLKIDAINVKNTESDKAVALTSTEYFWDYNFIGNSPFPPYGFKIYVSPQTSVGAHNLTIRTGILAEGKEPAVGVLDYTIEVVSDSTQLPVTGGQNVISATITPEAGS